MTFKIVALSVSALLWSAYFVARLHASGIRPLSLVLAGLGRIRPVARLLVLLAVGHLTFFAGGKHGGTNDVQGGGARSSFSRGGKDSAPLIATPSGQPSAGGYSPFSAPSFSLVSVGHDEAFDFTPPDTAVVATNWLLHGASTQPLRLSFDDWVFPFGEEGHSNFTVFASGVVMPGVVNTNIFLKPFSATLGIVPQANWGRISSPSLFWHELTSSNTLLLTWQNALLDRAETNPVSFQAELKPSGGFVFRYDLSRLASDELLTNVVIGAKNGEAKSFPLQEDGIVDFRTSGKDSASPFSVTNLTSLSFQTFYERICDERRAQFDEKMGGDDPYLYPEGSTNTVLEHVFYSGTTNGPFAYPQSTDGNAVLMVSVSGRGSGELLVGSSFVPLCGRPAPVANGQDARSTGWFAAPRPSPATLAVTVPRGSTQRVYMRGDSTLSVSFDSGDFAFGELPDLSGRRFSGWINFPFVNATVPCIHDYNAKKKLVSLPLGSGTGDLTCEWQGTPQIDVENIPPVSAMLTGHFSGRTTTPVAYTLSHPSYLFGQATYSQTARYCPRPPEDGGGFYDGEVDNPVFCWCCFWGSCWEGCECGCSCDVGSGGEPEEPPPDDPEPEDYEASKTNLLAGVLKIRDPLEYAEPIRLTVPHEHRNCCPCPDHATNRVSVVYRSQCLKVVDADTEQDFASSGESLDVKVAGVLPSTSPGDAQVSFAANGEVTDEDKYTVLGVGIDGGCVPDVGDVDLRLLNAYNPDFGLPIPVNTNLLQAAELRLKTDVRLPFGNIHLGFENATVPFSVWMYDGWTCEFVELANSGEGGELDISFAHWRQLVGGSTDASAARTQVYVTASGAGHATLVYRYWGVTGKGGLVADEARQVVTAVNPPVTGDVNNDGQIDGTDADFQIAGRPFRFWYNADAAKGDYVGQVADSRCNSDDFVVNGKYDLVNLFPLKLDVSDFRQAWGSAAQLRLCSGSSRLKFCILNDLPPQNVAAMQTETIHTADSGVLESAELAALDYGGTNLTEVLTAGSPTAMLAFEASGPVSGESGPVLVVSLGDRDVFSYRIPMSVTSVDEMYRYLNLRGAEAGGTFAPYMPDGPSNLPDAETDAKNYVFVHGYNVNAAQSRDWARAIFKRLWWAGSRSKFTAVDWHGDYSQIADWVSPNYYQNVVHALRTAPALKAACDALPGEKVMLAHSLGNMLTCEAIVRHGLQYSRYYMLNAAVPIEAFDAGADVETNMKPLSWQRYSGGLFACNWYERFSPEDGRSGLTWRGIFAGVHDAVNCYSPTEDVLGNAPDVGAGGAWSAQELLKGTGTMYLLPRVRREGGWGFNPEHTVPLSQNGELLKTEYTDEEMVTSPPFLPFAEGWLHATNAVAAAQVAEVRDRILADGIPAQTFAAGANAVDVFGDTGNYNYQGQQIDGWPRKDRRGNSLWYHSDIKDVSFFFTYPFFSRVVKGNSQ